MRVTVAASLIEIDERGRSWISGANTKVIEVALDKVAYGWRAQEMHEQHPHLSLAEIHAALSYYYAHQAEFDAEIERQKQEYEALWAAAQSDPLQRRLRELALQRKTQ